MKKIFAIIVTYNPDQIQLQKTIDSLYGQVDEIVIVKNSYEQLNFDKKINEKIHFIQLNKNMGIAYAQNRGIEYALIKESDFVLFSDQDTVYPSDFVEKIFLCFERHKEEKIAAVVPYFYNDNKNQYARINVSKSKSIIPIIGRDYEVSHAISSGTVVENNIFNDVGMMNEKLFIDWVDFEWCWRAEKKKYKVICDTGNIIHHNMGDSYKSILGKKIVIYSNFRNYYFFRNGFYLLYHSGLFSLKEWLGFYKFMKIKVILFHVLNGVSWENNKLLLRAYVDGVLGKMSC